MANFTHLSNGMQPRVFSYSFTLTVQQEVLLKEENITFDKFYNTKRILTLSECRKINIA